MDAVITALSTVLAPDILLVMLAASAFGILLGAIPGLTATMGAALLVPITFFMEPLPAIAAVIAVATSAIFAGDLPGALLRIPGTPASAAYVDDAHAYTLEGRAVRGLTIGLFASVAGGLIGTVALVFGAPLLSRVALGFSAVEYFWLAALGLSCAAIVSGDNYLKGLASLLIGLFAATIGVDVIAGAPRFTFGQVELMGGIGFIPALIGLFAFSEIMRNATARRETLTANAIPPQRREPWLWPALSAVFRRPMNLVRGGPLGALIGALPGAGADIAAWINYAVAKRLSRTPERFGKAHPEGLVAAGAANNGALGGAWVPTLVFGIPGDTITAIGVGVLMMKGIQPGPTVFLLQGELMSAIFAAFFVANLLLIFVGLAAIFTARRLLQAPKNVLLPLILLFCAIGAYTVQGATYGIILMLVFGLLGWIMCENDIPLAPAILGLILGGMLEFNFTTSLMRSHGDFAVFFSSPIAIGLAVVTALAWLTPVLKRAWIAATAKDEQPSA